MVGNMLANYVNYTYDNIGQLKTAQGFEQGGTARLHEQFGYGYDHAWNLNYRTNNALVETFNVHPVRYGATGRGQRPRGQPVTASLVGCMYLSHGVNNLNELATNARKARSRWLAPPPRQAPT